MKTVQLWPAGKTANVYDDGRVEVRDGDGFRPATDEEKTAVKVEDMAERLWGRECYCLDSSLVSDMLGAELGRELASEWSYDNVANSRTCPDNWDYQQCADWLEERGIKPASVPHVRIVYYAYVAGTGANGQEAEECYVPATCVAGLDADGLCAFVAKVEGYALVTSAEVSEGQYNADEYEWDADDEADAMREQVRDNAEDAEIMEWWRVSEWFGKKLTEIGEPVLSNSYGHWWGRTCSGQSVMMDGTLQEIAAKMV